MSEEQQCDYSFNFKLDDFQEEALFHINNGKSVVVCAPTGAGKPVLHRWQYIRLLKKVQGFFTQPL